MEYFEPTMHFAISPRRRSPGPNIRVPAIAALAISMMTEVASKKLVKIAHSLWLPAGRRACGGEMNQEPGGALYTTFTGEQV
jgi:hypothetical protein